MKSRKTVKINLKKFIRSIVLIIGVVILVTFLLTRSIYAESDLKTKTIYIEEGQTLWEVAKVEQKSNSYYKNKSIGEIIYDIKETNNLDNSTIIAGDILKVYYR